MLCSEGGRRGSDLRDRLGRKRRISEEEEEDGNWQDDPRIMGERRRMGEFKYSILEGAFGKRERRKRIRITKWSRKLAIV